MLSQLAVSGNKAVTVFRIKVRGSQLTMSNLTVENGYVSEGDDGDGGGIDNLGTLNLTGLVVDRQQCLGGMAVACYSEGSLSDQQHDHH